MPYWMCYLVSWLLWWPYQTPVPRNILLSMPKCFLRIYFYLSLHFFLSFRSFTEWSTHLFKRCGQKSIKLSLLVFLTFVVFHLFHSIYLSVFSVLEKKVIYFKWSCRWYCNFVFITFYCFCFLHQIFHLVA